MSNKLRKLFVPTSVKLVPGIERDFSPHALAYRVQMASCYIDVFKISASFISAHEESGVAIAAAARSYREWPASLHSAHWCTVMMLPT